MLENIDLNSFRLSSVPTESEIMANWQGDIERPVVSICCITYNHERYIEDTLKGFLIQKTDFPFEILIHDDASTDATSSILRKYQRDYPTLIKLVIQDENQYSKGERIFPKLYNIAKGDYISLCEGDDFWLDTNKTNQDATYLKNNPHCSFVFSPSLQIKNDKIDFVRNRYTASKIEKVDISWVLNAGGGFFPTCSTTFRRKIFELTPNWFDLHGTGDYPLAILARLRGNFGYINQVMTVYRSHDKSVSHQKFTSKKEAACISRLKYKKSIIFFNAMFEDGVIDVSQYYKMIDKEKYMLVKRDFMQKEFGFWQAFFYVDGFLNKAKIFFNMVR